MAQNTLYWHDYETFGIDPRRDRPVQFAGIRTDEDLNIIGESLNIFARPAPDTLPHPMSSIITGITPQQALEQGIPEAEFIERILQELSQPGTCGVGYNSLRFDDEVTRNTLYRNLYDPYTREWQNGNSRWDIIDLVRMCRTSARRGSSGHSAKTPSAAVSSWKNWPPPTALSMRMHTMPSPMSTPPSPWQN